MALYKMSELAPLALAEINAIIRLATDKEKQAAQSADRETITGKEKRVRRARRSKQLELQLIKQR
jgi:hypothetical protein